MSYNFKKLSTVESVETVSDKANVLIEENGVIKKAPKSQVGGANGAGVDTYCLVYDRDDRSIVLVTDGLFEGLCRFTQKTPINFIMYKLWEDKSRIDTCTVSIRYFGDEDYFRITDLNDEYAISVYPDSIKVEYIG